MRFPVNFLEFSDGVVRVHLRSREAAVPQQFLDRIQVGSLIHQVGGKTVTEHVGTLLIQRGRPT